MTYNCDELGTLEVKENIWTGSLSFYLNGREFKKINKKSFVIDCDDKEYQLLVFGSFFEGTHFSFNGNRYTFKDAIPWYLVVLASIPFLLSMTIGNIPYFAQIGFYYVGGAIGGALNAVFGCLIVYFSRKVNKAYLRLLISLLIIAIAVLATWGVGNIIVAVARN